MAQFHSRNVDSKSLSQGRRWSVMLAGVLVLSTAGCGKNQERPGVAGEAPSGVESEVAGSLQQELAELRVRNARLEEENRMQQARSGSQTRVRSLEVQDLRKRVEELQATLKTTEEAHQRYVEQQKTAMDKLVHGLRLGSVRVASGDLTGVVITSVESDGVKVTHDGGIAKVTFQQLPVELQFLLGRAEATTAKSGGSLAGADGKANQSGGGSDGSSTPGSTMFEQESLLIIKTDRGTGSGFIVKADGKFYAYTNAHVLCGSPGGFNSKLVSVTTANGTALPLP